MRYKNKGPVRIIPFQVLHQYPFRLLIQRRCRFVQQQYRTVAQQSAGNGNSLRLPFTQSAALFPDKRIQPVGQSKHKIRYSRPQSPAHLFPRRFRISHPQVLTNRPAEQRVPLRHIRKVTPRTRRHLHRLLSRAQPDNSRLRFVERQQQSHQCCLACSGLAHHRRTAPGRETARKVAEHRSVPRSIRKVYPFHVHIRRLCQPQRTSRFLFRQTLQLPQPANRCHPLHQRRNQPSHVPYRLLYLPHQLQKSRHRTECDAAVTQAPYSPTECHQIAARESPRHTGTSPYRETGTLQQAHPQTLLFPLQPMKPFPAYFQSPYHIPLLQTFLNHRLYPAVRPPDPACIAIHTLHVQPASQQEKGQNPYHQPDQSRIQPVKESKSRQQLYAQNHKGR